MTAPLRIAAMISGGGRTLLNLADRIDEGSLRASIELVIASREDIEGVERARERDLDVQVIARRDFDAEEAFHDKITARITEAGADLVCLCGYLKWMRIDEPLRDRVMNIHPALLPDFGGRGMFGSRVHRAVLEAGRSFSGCTVHFVDEKYDHGPIILQRTCPVLPGDTEQTLASRVFEEECRAYPEAIQLFAKGRLRVEDGRVIISPAAPIATRPADS